MSGGKVCRLDNCGRPLCAKGLCRLHWERQHRTGTTDDPDPRTGHRNPMWKGDDASYAAIHQRMSTKPRPSMCELCGASEGRFEWALRPELPADQMLVSPEGLRYSVDPTNYQNLCKTCHNQQDLSTSTCRRGHDLADPENIYVQPSNGKRFCRACAAIRRRSRYAREKRAS